jgi:hypothetical protein
MFDIHIIVIVSILIGVLIGVAKYLGNPVILLGGLLASGAYYFLVLHHFLLAFLKVISGHYTR